MFSRDAVSRQKSQPVNGVDNNGLLRRLGNGYSLAFMSSPPTGTGCIMFSSSATICGTSVRLFSLIYVPEQMGNILMKLVTINPQ